MIWGRELKNQLGVALDEFIEFVTQFLKPLADDFGSVEGNEPISQHSEVLTSG